MSFKDHYHPKARKHRFKTAIIAHYVKTTESADLVSEKKNRVLSHNNYADWHEDAEKHGGESTAFKIKNAGGRTEAHARGKVIGSFDHTKKAGSVVTEETLTEGAHDFQASFPLATHPTVAHVQAALNKHGKENYKHGDDGAYDHDTQLAHVEVKHVQTPHTDPEKIHDHHLDHAQKWGALHAHRGATHWHVGGWIAESVIVEGKMPLGVIKHKQKLGMMSNQELHGYFHKAAAELGKDVEEHARSTAWRHGYGQMSDHYWNKIKPMAVKEEVIDSLDQLYPLFESAGMFKVRDEETILEAKKSKTEMKRKYLGKARGRTHVGTPAHGIDTDPTLMVKDASSSKRKMMPKPKKR